MPWEYRVMKTNNPHGDEYVIAEVYDTEQDDGTDVVEGWAVGNESKGMTPWGEDPEELRWVLESMLAACDKPVLDEAELLAMVENDNVPHALLRYHW